MSESVVNIERRAAFEMGYYEKWLRDAHETMCERGEHDEPAEIDGLIDGLDHAGFCFWADDQETYKIYKSMLNSIFDLYEEQGRLLARGEFLSFQSGGPEPLWLLIGEQIDRLGVLHRRALRGDEGLEAWFRLGSELAALNLRLYPAPPPSAWGRRRARCQTTCRMKHLDQPDSMNIPARAARTCPSSAPATRRTT